MTSLKSLTPAQFLCSLALLMAVFAMPSGAADLTKTEEILAHHIDSIGSSAVRAAIKDRVVEGAALYRIMAGGTGSMEGKAVIASQGSKTRFLLKLPSTNYHGEQIIYDGSRLDVAATYSDKRRSEFADFIRAQDAPIRDGLLGGVLTSAWPPLQSNGMRRFAFEGSKKVDGNELLVFRYHPRKSSDLQILVYFDPVSFHHVRTTYHAGQSAPISLNDIQSARQTPSRFSITEEFGQFQEKDGLTLPTRYTLRFISEQQPLTKEIAWEVSVGQIMNNIELDPRNFEIK